MSSISITGCDCYSGGTRIMFMRWLSAVWSRFGRAWNSLVSSKRNLAHLFATRWWWWIAWRQMVWMVACGYIGGIFRIESREIERRNKILGNGRCWENSLNDSEPQMWRYGTYLTDCKLRQKRNVLTWWILNFCFRMINSDGMSGVSHVRSCERTIISLE